MCACFEVVRVGLALRSDSHRADRSRLPDLGWPLLTDCQRCTLTCYAVRVATHMLDNGCPLDVIAEVFWT
jgi:hypothetical protein